MSNNEFEIKRRLQSYSRRLFIQRAGLLGGMIALGGGGFISTTPEEAGPPTRSKVGIATDLTGAISWGGIPNANVAKMVVDDMNANGGLLGRPLQMILEDTATNEALAVTRVRKLVTQDKVDVVFGGITSSMRNAIKDTIVNRGKTLYIYPQLYEGRECTPYLFCSGPTPAQQCDTFIPWLIKNGGRKLISLPPTMSGRTCSTSTPASRSRRTAARSWERSTSRWTTTTTARP